MILIFAAEFHCIHEFFYVAVSQITADTLFSQVHLAAILQQCKYELGRNNSMFTYNNATGTLEPPQELEEICQNDCTGRGQCVEGG